MVLAEVFPGCSFVSSRKTQGVVNNTSLMRRADQAWGGIRCQKMMLSEFLRFFFFSPLAGGTGLGSIQSRGRLGGRARARGARRGKAAAADQEAGYGSLHAP